MSDNVGWLQISTAGFAALNQSRPTEHLVKELVQNSLDAVEDTGGAVELDYHHDGRNFVVECSDTGTGIEDLAAMRVVYLTFKTDSHLKRGRFGRGFKEILSVANSATIVSGGRQINFIEERGHQVTREAEASSPISGTRVSMTFDWPAETAGRFDDYFNSLFVPNGVQLLLNGRHLTRRAAAHTVEAALPTEVYDTESRRWDKPQCHTFIELVDVRQGEKACIYEMGIPVAEAEWSVPYHSNIFQRVPMNPNRDALASGYARHIHKACLPTLLSELSQAEATADWVGSAGAESAPEIQRQIIARAFGEHAVRSIPADGKRDFDHDAERIGASVVNTEQMSSGFRDMAKMHLRTTREVVSRAEANAAKTVAEMGFVPQDVIQQNDMRAEWIIRQGGEAHISHCLSFAVWFCQKLVDSSGDMPPKVTGNIAIGGVPVLLSGAKFGTFLAHWSEDNVLTLAIDVDCFWKQPLGAESLSILVHEASHARNMHHGKSFVEEIERLSGVAAAVMFASHNEITRTWPELVSNASSDENAMNSLRDIAEAKLKRSWLWNVRRRTL